MFCDAECIREYGDSAACNGPWYCAKTRICQQFNHREGGNMVDPQWPECIRRRRPFSPPPVPSEETRVGVVVKSCANHSQCFPTEAQALKGGIVLPQGGMTEYIKRYPFMYSVRGFQVETTCCTNGPNYRNDRNLPCNGAAALAPRLAALLLAAAALLFA